MHDHPISSNAGVGRHRRIGRPRKYTTDATRKLAWCHRQRPANRRPDKTGEATIQDGPQVQP